MNHKFLPRPAALAICALAGAAGLAGGWLLHSGRSRNAEEKAVKAPSAGEVSAKATAGSPSDPAAPNGKVKAGAAEMDSLEQRLAVSPRVERWLILVAAAEKAGADDMPHLLQLCRGDSVAQHMVAARWAELDCAGMWRAISDAATKGGDLNGGVKDRLGMDFYDLGSALFDVWITRDMAAACAALSQDDIRGINYGRQNLLDRFLKADPESGLKLMSQWGVKHYFPEMKSVVAWAEKNPRHAADVVKECGGESGILEAVKEIGKAWAKQDAAAALEYAAGLPAVKRSAMASGAINAWAEKDPAAAAAFVAGQVDAAFRAELARSLVGAWAKSAPEDALAWSGASLRGEARSNAIAGVIEGVAKKDLAAAANLVAGLDPGGAKNTAIGKLALQWFEKSGSQPVIDWLVALPDADARSAALDQLQWRWTWTDPEGAAAFATGPHAALTTPEFTAQVASSQARRDPESAMKWVAQLPANHQSEARDRVLSEWMSSRPESAAAWVLRQPAGEGRKSLIEQATRYVVWNGTEAAEKFFGGLPASERAIAREALRTNGMDHEKLQAMLKALEK